MIQLIGFLVMYGFGGYMFYEMMNLDYTSKWIAIIGVAFWPLWCMTGIVWFLFLEIRDRVLDLYRKMRYNKSMKGR